MWKCRPLVNRCPQNVIGGGTITELQHITFHFLSDVSGLNLYHIYIFVFLSVSVCLPVLSQAQVAFLQGERKGQENMKQDLVRRIKMLEYALKQER